MKNALQPAGIDRAILAPLISGSMRCWRQAFDARLAVQPHLSALLAVKACAVLAPVLDSLFRFYEVALRRPLTVGDADNLSEDERLLVHLIERPDHCRAASIGCTAGAMLGLNCALCSARVMLALTLDGPPLQ